MSTWAIAPDNTIQAGNFRITNTETNESYLITRGSVIRITSGKEKGKLAMVHSIDLNSVHCTYGKRNTKIIVPHGSYTTRY